VTSSRRLARRVPTGLLAAAVALAAGATMLAASPASPAHAVTAVPAVWTPVPSGATAASGPDGRVGAAMAYDGATADDVMFGGVTDDGTAPSANDTWVWNGTGWRQLHLATSPSPRTAATMAYDAAAEQLMLFGGGNGTADGTLATQSDTWVLTGTTWKQLHPARTPLARLAAAMAYDPGNGTVVLFGGADAAGDSLGDTWVWNGHTWSQADPAHSPGRRVDAMMASDPATGDVVLFGGVGGSGQAMSDTWIWDGADWSQLTPSVSPPARSSGVLDFDASLGSVVLTGGAGDAGAAASVLAAPASQAATSSPADASGLLADTWTFDGSTWSPLPVSGSAPEVSLASGAFDVASSQFVVFGGAGPTGPPVPSTSLLSGGGVVLTRLAGADRTGTALAISQAGFAAGTAKAVVLARNDVITDALTGGPLAGFEGGPLLLTDPQSLTPSVGAEIKRLLPRGGPVYLLGGSAALSPAVSAQLTAAGYQVQRIAGADRYSTAVAIADAMGHPTTVFEAAASDVADALSGVPAAILSGAPILLTNGSRPAAATTAYLDTDEPAARYALGGPAAAADPGATPIIGIDRYATSALIASTFFAAPAVVGVANGVTGADALAAGVYVGLHGGPLLLVPPSGSLPPSIASYLSTTKAGVTTVSVFGGPVAVTQQLADLVGVALR
jgi:hypothetical protein